MKKILLTQDKYALVDNKDYLELMKYKWYANKLGKTYYAIRNKSIKGGQKRGVILMHQQILGIKEGKEIDHIDGNGLNNQRKNLRFASKAENQRNRGIPSNNTSGFKCIAYNKRTKRWEVTVTMNQVVIRLGSFSRLLEAKKVYKDFVKNNYGEFGRIK